MNRLPRDAYRVEPAVGVPYRSLFRDTGAPYFNSLRPEPIEPTIAAGSVTAGASADLPDFRGRFPLLDRGFEKDNADVKIGPLYLKMRALSGAMLFSDNINRDEEDEEADVIGIVRFGLAMTMQLTEGFQINAAGNFVWLPFEGKFGIAGFPLDAPYTFGLEANSIARTQVVWDTMIGGWNVIFADEFSVNVGRFSLGARDDFELFEGFDFDAVDRAGRYSFSARGSGARDGDFRRTEQDELGLVYFSNQASITTERMLPGTIRLRLRATNENLWYNQGNRGQPRLRQTFTALARSERETQRFKPFVLYHAAHTDRFSGFDHSVRAGIDGPITEQLGLHLDSGWYHRSQTGANHFLWSLRLNHIAGPYTRQSLAFERTVNDLSEEITDHVGYHLHQILGSKLSLDAYAIVGTSEDLDEEGHHEFFRTGARLNATLGPRTTAHLGYTYSHILDEPEDDDRTLERDTHTIRLELTYHWTDSLLSRLIYQYQNREASRGGTSFDENLIYVSVSKYFD
jgi:hypothetical protein